MNEKNPVTPETNETAPVSFGDIERCFQEFSARITQQMTEAAQADSDRAASLDSRESLLSRLPWKLFCGLSPGFPAARLYPQTSLG